MPKLSEASRKTVAWVALWVAVLGAAANVGFWAFGAWKPEVLWGSLLGFAAGVGCFVLLCLTVEKAVTREPKDARRLVQLSQQGRLLLQAAVLVLAFTVKCFNPWVVIIMLLAPQIPIRLYPLMHKEEAREQTGAGGDPID